MVKGSEVIVDAVAVISPETEILFEDAKCELIVAQMYVIADNSEYLLANDELNEVMRKRQALEALKESIYRPAKIRFDEINTPLQNGFNGPIASLKSAEDMRKKQLVIYRAKAKREKDEAVRKAAEDQAKEQAKLQAAAEKKADKLIAKGNEVEADMVLTTVPIVPMAAAAVELPKAEGLSGTIKYVGVVNLAVLMKHAPQYITELSKKDQDAINAIGVASEGKTPIPGVVWTEEETLSKRTK